jgi:hypothetical protein
VRRIAADEGTVSFAAPLQSRLVVVLGGLAALALAALMIARATVLSSDEVAPAPVVPHVPRTHAATPATPATPPATRSHSKPVSKPVVKLAEGLPAGLASALHRERVVVAALWAPRSGDRAALAAARAGAKDSGAGFVALNVLDERNARLLEPLVGTMSSPSTVVFTRPGKVANRFDGFADAKVVSQAAHDAGSR